VNGLPQLLPDTYFAELPRTIRSRTATSFAERFVPTATEHSKNSFVSPRGASSEEEFPMKMLTIAAALFALASPATAWSYGGARGRSSVGGPYAYEVPSEQVTIIRHRHRHRYWKPGDLWPRSRGLLDRNAPGCPYEAC
jgi:hypothetical protein